jgi:single-stranded-DNA-specific exonuclease
MDWKLNESVVSDHKIKYYSGVFGMAPLLTKILLTRGITSEEMFYPFAFPTTDDLHDPFQLNDMKKAVIRIIQAIKRNEKIVIYGDYDVDGITSTSLLYKGLTFFNAKVTALLPTREDGYGLTEKAIEKVLPLSPSLIITVDNGSNAHEALTFASTHGIEVIVTDHHDINGEHPHCFAFINPKRSDCNYPNPDLCGAGVAFKLVHALFHASGNHEWRLHVWNYIELAALGTIADLMPLTGENRVITKLGMAKMNNNPSAHFKCLFKLLKLDHIDSNTLSFLIAPIFNACGRISNPNEALQALITTEPQTEEFARFIEINEKRKRLTQEHFSALDEYIQKHKLYKKSIIMVRGEYPEGLIGILAARVVEKYYKPAIITTLEGKGSCRSVQNSSFSIINAIARCSEYLKSYGGHQAAAGLTVDHDQFDSFYSNLEHIVGLEPVIKPSKVFDGRLNIGDFSDALFEELQLMEPFGMKNQKPTFLNSQQPNSVVYFGNQQQHAKMYLGKKQALLFSKAKLLESLDIQNVSFLYSINSYERKNFTIHDLK